MPNDDGGLQSAAPATKTGTHLLKTSQKYCACHTKRLRHVTKQVWMSRSAMPARRNEATRRLKPPKVITFAELATGTAIRPSHGHLRTVADGCGRLRTVEHSLNPQTPQSETGTLATRSGKIHKAMRYLSTFAFIAFDESKSCRLIGSLQLTS